VAIVTHIAGDGMRSINRGFAKLDVQFQRPCVGAGCPDVIPPYQPFDSTGCAVAAPPSCPASQAYDGAPGVRRWAKPVRVASYGPQGLRAWSTSGHRVLVLRAQG